MTAFSCQQLRDACNLLNELSRLPGVGNVTVFGVGQYTPCASGSIRGKLLRPRPHAAGRDPGGAGSRASRWPAASSAPRRRRWGKRSSTPLDVQRSARLMSAQFERRSSSRPAATATITQAGVRSDRVELGAQTYSADISASNGAKPAAGLAIYLVAERERACRWPPKVKARKRWAALARAVSPPDVKPTDIPFDTTKFVNGLDR